MGKRSWTLIYQEIVDHEEKAYIYCSINYAAGPPRKNGKYFFLIFPYTASLIQFLGRKSDALHHILP